MTLEEFFEDLEAKTKAMAKNLAENLDPEESEKIEARWWRRHEQVRARRFDRGPKRVGRGLPPRGKWSEPLGNL